MSQPLWNRLEHRLPEVVDRTLHAYADRSPRYQGTVPDHLHRHMAHTCHAFGRLFLRAVRDGREPAGADLRLFRDRARDRGAEGLPVADFVDAYFVAAETLWDEVVSLAGGSPPGPAAGVLLRCLHTVANAAVQAHQREFQAAHSEEREAVRAVVRALVAGEPAADLAHRAGIRLADAYAVLALRFGQQPAESVGDAVGQRLAGRRKVHQLTRALTTALGEEVLAALDPDGGLVLRPSTPSAGAERDDLAAARAAMRPLREAAGADVSAGFAHAASLGAVPSAAGQARRLLRLSPNPGEVAVLGELLLEYHLDHDSAARPELESVVAALRADPDLLDTVRAYLAQDFNRRRTARALHVHPNTVDNRLTRVTTVTGADPRTARGLLLLGSALAMYGE
ncbi:PucR family transcriptional regulator [Pseudonocardia acaciae]|uniref:PucR family transcriptional regulator n=1 Tax=Pseudonocardia acaciae TaxID=551276 RepID=UPI00048AD7E4|nr:helix-turn-helix domain-containing protein [Pseudonocardia acaciae]